MAIAQEIPAVTKSQNIANFIDSNYFDVVDEQKINLESSSSLDLGCGRSPKNPFRANSLNGLDIADNPKGNVLKCDIFTQDFPFPDSSFQFITAIDFMEHIPRVIIDGSGATRFRFVEVMQEVYRCLSPGGVFFSYTPAYPSEAAFRDPTHVNIITKDTFPMYFCVRENCRPEAVRYGFSGAFLLMAQEASGAHLLTLLMKPASKY